MYSNNQLAGQRQANGAISAFRIVCEDTSADGKGIQATANRGRIIGIGPNYDVADGVMFQFSGAGTAQLLLGGSVTAGDWLKSDANGKGVLMALGGTTPQHCVGIAQRSGVSGDIIPVDVMPEDKAAGDDYLS
jgi:hypothetical protein